jgi:hypothetical protein
VLDGAGLLGLGVARPDPVAAAEVGDAAVGRDSRTGQGDDRPGLGDPLRRSLDRLVDRHLDAADEATALDALALVGGRIGAGVHDLGRYRLVRTVGRV